MRYQIQDKVLQCSHCDHQAYSFGTAKLNSTFLSFVDLDWLDPSAKILQCDRYGKIEWFSASTNILELDDLTESNCLSCAKTMPDGEPRCQHCGWTYI